MSSVQERLQLKRIPLDKWSVREQLCLASAVECSGDQNWMSVSRSLKMLSTSGAVAVAAAAPSSTSGAASSRSQTPRPSDWFSQKFCAAQYGKLLENVETPKRKKRTDKDQSGGGWNTVETPGESILRKLTHERMSELNRLIAEDQREHDRLKADIAHVQNCTDEAELLRILQQIETEKRAEEREAAQYAQWLREREARKLELERALRPSASGGTLYAHKVAAAAAAAAAAHAAAAATAATTAASSLAPSSLASAVASTQATPAAHITTAAPKPPRPAPSSAQPKPPPPPPQSTPSMSISTDVVDMDIEESPTVSSAAGTSPLLTSLLKCPASGSAAPPTAGAAPSGHPAPVFSTPTPQQPPSILSHSATSPLASVASLQLPPHSSTSTSARAAPTITNLLTGGNHGPPKLAGPAPPSTGPAGAASAHPKSAQLPPLSIATGGVPFASSTHSHQPTPPVQSPSQAAPTLSLLLETKTKEQAAAKQQAAAAASAAAAAASGSSTAAGRPSAAIAATPTPTPVMVTLPTLICSSAPATGAESAVDDSAADVDADAQLLMDEFGINALIPDNIDELADILDGAGDDSILHLMAGTGDDVMGTMGDVGGSLSPIGDVRAPIAAVAVATAVSPTPTGAGSAAATAVASATQTAIVADNDDDVQMVGMGDANDPIIDVAAAAAAAAAGGTELMTTAELVEQLTSSASASAAGGRQAPGFPLPQPVPATDKSKAPVRSEPRVVEGAVELRTLLDDDVDDEVELIEAAVKAEQMAAGSARLTPSVGGGERPGTVASATIVPAGLDVDDETTMDGTEIAEVAAPTSTSTSTVATKNADDDQSSSSNDAPLSELLLKQDKAARAAAPTPQLLPVIREEEPKEPAAKRASSERPDVFESDSNDDKCLEIIKREIHGLSGLKETGSGSSNENSNEASKMADSGAEEKAQVEADVKADIKADIKAELKPGVEDEAETIEAIVEAINKSGQEETIDSKETKAAVDRKKETNVATSDEEEDGGPTVAAADAANDDGGADGDNDDDDDDEDDDGFEKAKNKKALPEPGSSGKSKSTSKSPGANRKKSPAAAKTAVQSVQIVDTEDEDMPATPLERRSRHSGRSSMLAAAAAASSSTSAPASANNKRDANATATAAAVALSAAGSQRRARRDRSSQDPGTPQPPSDTDSTTSHLSASLGRSGARRRLRDRDRDRSESPYVGDAGAATGGGGSAGTSTGSALLDTTLNELLLDRSTRSKRRCSSSTPLLDSQPNSPASVGAAADSGATGGGGHQSQLADNTDRQHRAWKRGAIMALNRIAKYRHAAQFQLSSSLESSAAAAILRPMDLKRLRRNVESGQVRSTVELQRDVRLMCANWVMASSGQSEEVRAGQRRAWEMEEHALRCVEAVLEGVGGGGGGGGGGVGSAKAEEKVEKVAERPAEKVVDKSVATGQPIAAVASPAATASLSSAKLMRGRKSHRLPPN